MIYRMIIVTAGAGGVNAGNVKATADTDNSITAQINIGNNQTGMAIYQIPNDKTGYMTNFYASSADSGGAGANLDVRLLLQPEGEVFQTVQFHGLVAAGSTHFNHMFAAPMKVGRKSTLKMQVKTTSANSAAVSAGFDLVLVDI